MDRVEGLGRTVGEPSRPPCRRHAGAVLEVLHAERHPGQWAELLGPRQHGGVDGRSGRQGAFGVEMNERPQFTVDSSHTIEAPAGEALGRLLAVADPVRSLDDRRHVHGA